ncbi:14298_t:CDS:2 [Cetraspora pellucida]|uniref:14298_t:CDS:1 n=1 Tax=Cetraspora pellucida TaxID=1433469 RepID=A0A9N9B163_9GLOM|nr:14298_t:CDS:2 [Cetraspora pellucida]
MITFLNDNVRDKVSPTSNTPSQISDHFRNNNIAPTLETVIDYIIKLQAPVDGNFRDDSIVRIRELILDSISSEERDGYETLVNQVLHDLAPPPTPPQISVSVSSLPFSVSEAMLKGFVFCPHTKPKESQEYNYSTTLDEGIPPNY